MSLVATCTTILDSVDQLLTPQPLLDGVTALSNLASVTPGEVRLFLGLIAAYPIALTWRALPGPRPRHIFSVVVGLWLLQFVNGSQALLNIASVLVCYCLMWALGPRSARFVSFVALAMLAAGHLFRQITAYLEWTLDWTLVAMITTQKVMGLAFNVQDGVDEKASKEQKAYAVERLPSFFHFMSFILFPANVTIGPSFEYSDYMAFADGTNTAPPPYLPGLWRLLQGLACFAAHMVIAAKFPAVHLLASPTFFHQGNKATQYAQVWVALFAHRLKYYFGWKIAEGAACFSGLGYNGVDKHTGAARWDRVENISVSAYETSQSLRASSINWNKTTNLWLRRYVYDRAPASVNLYFTYLVSAFWHGFYPGYYIFFMSIAVCTSVHRSVRRTIRPRFMAPDGVTPGPFKPLYDVASAIATSVTVNYFIMSFVVLALDKSVAAFRGFGFFGHYALAIALAVFSSGLIKAPKKITDKKLESKAH